MDWNKELTHCTLCPRKCGKNRTAGEYGFCGMGAELRIARAALHFWEEPCISGKNGSGTVFFSGCHLGCKFCQNYEISHRKKGIPCTVSELSAHFLRLQEEGAHNINLVTPTHFVPQIIEALTLAKNQGLTVPVLYNCGGYEAYETLRKLDGLIDIYLPDLKYYKNSYARKYSGAPHYFETAAAAIQEMYRQTGALEFDSDGMLKKGVLVRHLMLPGLLFDSKKILDYLIRTYGDNIQISLMSQYTPMPQVSEIPELFRRIPKGHYETLIDYAASLGAENIYIQEDSSSGEQYIPSFQGDEPK